jgi:hypothetical protein
MKKHEFKENDFVIFDSISQRVEYCLIAKANMYPIDNFCVDKEQKACEIRFRPYAKGFTTWYMGPEDTETKITPQEFLKLISQYEIGDEVEVIDNTCGHPKSNGEIITVTKINASGTGFSSGEWGYHWQDVKLHKSISNKQSKTTGMKKFKNRFAVTGSKSLLKAFKDELLAIGYKCKHNNDDVSFVICNDYGSTIANGEYHTNSSKGELTTMLYTLPQDWDTALAAAKETVEENVVLFKVGDKVILDCKYQHVKENNDYTGDLTIGTVYTISECYIGKLGKGDVCVAKVKGGLWYTVAEKFRLATAAEIKASEQKTYQFGGRTMYRCNEYLADTATGGGEIVSIGDLKVWYKWYNMMPQTASNHSLSIPDGHLKVGCTTGTLHEALAICKDLFD